MARCSGFDVWAVGSDSRRPAWPNWENPNGTPTRSKQREVKSQSRSYTGRHNERRQNMRDRQKLTCHLHTGIFIKRTKTAMFSRGFTKPLIFTLLCLVYFTNAFLDADKLREMKMKVEELQQRHDRLKEYDMPELSALSELMDEGVDLMERLAEYMELLDLPPGFPSLHGYMEKVKKYVWKTKDLTDSQMKEFAGKIQENDKKLRKLRKLINFMEETGAEL
ncbi:uncharacterized protein LOC115439015 [Sphaeramia orbicularis]|uniref:uncharacterized protein LOC115439015 n=1 Tax=Sphaeramia orbicularis TaxID=375764 RepID=UPI00117FB17E|nr:uncharacterized protein LOC115439015 [Sphaeramia orbicularis]